MKILVLGGTQACGPGLPARKGFLTQLVRRLRLHKATVQVDYRPVGIDEANRLLPGLPLADFDLILLQFDWPGCRKAASPVGRLVTRALPGLNRVAAAQLSEWRNQLIKVLLQVRTNNRQVVLLSPFPHRSKFERHWRRRLQLICMQESREWQVSLFDVRQHLPGGDELFQAGSDDQLSAVAHEVLGSELHTFLTEPSYTVWP